VTARIAHPGGRPYPKVGRNDPCPCGSGRKFKKCCLDATPQGTTAMPPEVAEEARRRLAAHEMRRRDHLAMHGRIREPVHADFQGRKIVAVGSTLMFSRPERPWKTFHDFLIDYARSHLGKGWAESEQRLPPSERHPLYRMHTGLVEFLRIHGKDVAPGEVSHAITTGDIAGFLAFAYDLFVVADNAELQASLLRRIKKRNAYQGARHELFAAATIARRVHDRLRERT
jgi:hypothetical protein